MAGKRVERSWQDNDGDKRQTVEIQVNHLGPDLQFAVAEVAKSTAEGLRRLGRSFGCVLDEEKQDRLKRPQVTEPG
ncbi:MAG: hypothetical protein M3N53_06200 [Actinomycetota bacterium]|nr:hypothetical protein [Actinomycetota bacterium]